MKKPRQATFAESGFERCRKVTRREKFLAEMDRVVPWKELCAVVEPFYPKGSSGAGRQRRSAVDFDGITSITANADS